MLMFIKMRLSLCQFLVGHTILTDVNRMSVNVARNAWSRNFVRFLRKRRVSPPLSDATVGSALTDSVLYRDLQTALDDEWATPPYPKSEQVIKDIGTRPEVPKVDPESTSVLLFPGQGSQFVGMGKGLLKYPNVKDLYECASEILGYDLLKLCLEGPKEELDRTEHSQPAVFVTSLAAVERLRDDFPMAIENCVAAAGFSVGEYAALTYAGSISYESALRLVKVRAGAMQEASEMEPSGMMTVMLRASSKLGVAMEASKKYMKSKGYENPVCQVANHLFVQCKVIGGHEEALQFFADNATSFNVGPIKRLPVSGAFHTVLMEPAREPLEDALRNTKISDPLITVCSNVNGKRHSGNPWEIRKALLRQLYRPVMWEQVMHYIFDRKVFQVFPKTYEMGPGTQLTGILRRINGKAASGCTPVLVR